MERWGLFVGGWNHESTVAQEFCSFVFAHRRWPIESMAWIEIDENLQHLKADIACLLTSTKRVVIE